MGDPKKLNSGEMMPAIGFGTWDLKGPEATSATLSALKTGYRLIDTAKLYGNEAEVGRAIHDSGIARDKLFIVTKLWNSDQGYHTARVAYEESMERLKLETVDLYLIHSPATEQRHSAWKALEEIYREHHVQAVGVSNYQVWHLQDLMDRSELVPAVNQIELHPFNYKQQQPILDFCAKNGIVVMAYSPLNHGHRMDDVTISELAAKHRRTNAQIMLRWAIQHDTVPIPKSADPGRIVENLDVFDFELSEADIEALDKLGAG